MMFDSHFFPARILLGASVRVVFLQGNAFPLEGKQVGKLIVLSAITEHGAQYACRWLKHGTGL